MEQRVVMCVKLGRELPGLEYPPLPGALGQRVFEQVSAEAWKMWQSQATILVNHYGLNMADPEARRFLNQQMEEFFFGEDARMPEGWTPEGSGAPAAKGGGAPARKK